MKISTFRNGLAVATEYVVDDPEELRSPRHYYTDYVTLLRDAEVKKVIKPGTPIVYTGKIGSVDYQSKITSYGRLRISKILDADLDYLPVLDDPMKRIDAKAATKLSAYLNGFPEDGVEKRQALQKFALMVVTLAGNVTFDYKTLYTNTNTETYKKICDIADAPDLTNAQKLALLTKEYQKYEKEVESSFSKDLKDELNRAGRVKISSISALNSPQLIVSGVDETPVITRGNLLSGYTEKDMVYHAIENRSLQAIKQSGVG